MRRLKDLFPDLGEYSGSNRGATYNGGGLGMLGRFVTCCFARLRKILSKINVSSQLFERFGTSKILPRHMHLLIDGSPVNLAADGAWDLTALSNPITFINTLIVTTTAVEAS